MTQKNPIFTHIFKKDTSHPGHTRYIIFGLKFSFINKVFEEHRKYYSSFKNPLDIPKAQGTLRFVQEASLVLLKEFDKLCKQNDLKYWLDFGTLLGAKRHKGFIPWDDDIDCSMARDDYEKLIKLFKENKINSDLLKLTFQFNNKNKCYIKLRCKQNESIFVDIFPYDFYYKQIGEDEKLKLSNKIANCTKKRLLSYFSTEEKLRNHFKKLTENKLLEKNKVEETQNLPLFMALDFPHRWKNKVFDYDEIFPLKKIEFEDFEFSCPNMTEKILEKIFGNYMEMPKDCYPRHSGYIKFEKEELDAIKEMLK